MKDKRQRMAINWPFAMYGDPTFAATLLAAASATMPHSPYHGAPGIPPPHLGPSYQTAAAAAYYARYNPYQTPGSVNSGMGGGATAGLHRPHPQSAAYPPHPHLLQQHHPLGPAFNLSSLAAVPPSMASNGYMSTPTTQPSAVTPPTYRPAHIPDLSPTHSDTSSDCDCAGSLHLHHAQHQFPGGKTSPTLNLPRINITGLPHSHIHSIQSAFESKGINYHRITTSPSSPVTTKIEPPKLFQPYKSDLTEKA